MEANLQPGAIAPAPLPRSTGFEAPEHEAAFFFGLFLRGYSYQELRQDIEVPPAVQLQWNAPPPAMPASPPSPSRCSPTAAACSPSFRHSSPTKAPPSNSASAPNGKNPWHSNPA